VIAAIYNGLALLGISTAGTQIATALVLLAAVSVDSWSATGGVARRSRGLVGQVGLAPIGDATERGSPAGGWSMPPQGVMPAFLQMAASEPLQSWSAETSPPATVAAMLRAVTASG